MDRRRPGKPKNRSVYTPKNTTKDRAAYSKGIAADSGGLSLSKEAETAQSLEFKNLLMSTYFQDFTSEEINSALSEIIDNLDSIEYKSGKNKNEELMERIVGSEFQNEINDSSFLEFYLDKKQQIDSLSLDPNKKQPIKNNPFKFDAFESINKIATILNYDVYSVLEHDRKNPFKMINNSIAGEIERYSKELEKLTKANRESMKLFRNTVLKESEKEKKKNNITMALASRELEYLKQTVINLELKQLAESCVRVHSKRRFRSYKGNKTKAQEYEYRMIFDESIRIPPLWLSQEQYQLLNQNREDYKSESGVVQKTQLDNYVQFPTNDDTSIGFCHQCKQRKSGIILAKCSYNSATMGHAVPSVVSVKGVTAYNVEAYNTQAINYVIKTQI